VKKKSSPKKATKPLDLAAIVRRLTSGQSTLFEESKRAGLTPNTPLRNALRKHLGGVKPYEAMIAKAMKARSKSSDKEEPQGRVKQAA
jgi:lambda repressor-like predicted transcriptional regulator